MATKLQITTFEEKIEALNHMLEKERALVVRTQQNYAELKRIFIDIEAENKSLKSKLGELDSDMEEYKRMKEECEQIEVRRKQLIVEMEKDRIQREIDAEQLRTEVLEHNRTLYQSELEHCKKQIDDLKAGRTKLEISIQNLNEELDTVREERNRKEKEWKAKVMGLKKDFEAQIEMVIEDVQRSEDQKKSMDMEKYEARIVHLEESLLQKSEEKLNLVDEYSKKCTELDGKLHEEKKLRIEQELKCNRLESEVESSNARVKICEQQIETLHKQLNDKNLEIVALMKEANNEGRIFKENLREEEEKWSERMRDFEKIIDVLNKKIDLQNNQLEEAKTSQTNLLKVNEELKLYQRLLEDEKDLHQKSVQKNEERIELLKHKQTILENQIVVLKKSLESNPETSAAVNRLQEIVDRKDVEINMQRSKTRQIIEEFTTKLDILEDRQMKMKSKIQERILTSRI